MALPAGWVVAANKQAIPPHQSLSWASVPATGTDPGTPAAPHKVQNGTEKGEPIRYQGATQRPAIAGVGTAQAAGRAPTVPNQVAATPDATPLTITTPVAKTGLTVTLALTNIDNTVYVLWGDATQPQNITVATPNKAHTFTKPGTYTIYVRDPVTGAQASEYVKVT